MGRKAPFQVFLEEAWFSIANGKPLYLVGGFGWMAGAVVDLLEGRTVEEFSDDFTREKVDDYQDVLNLHEKYSIPFISAEQMTNEIQLRGKGISGALNNG